MYQLQNGNWTEPRYPHPSQQMSEHLHNAVKCQTQRWSPCRNIVMQLRDDLEIISCASQPFTLLQGWLRRAPHRATRPFPKNKVPDVLMPKTSFFDKYVHGIGWHMVHTRHPHGHSWHLSICPTVTSGLVSWSRSNRCPKYGATRWQLASLRRLLRVAYQPGIFKQNPNLHTSSTMPKTRYFTRRGRFYGNYCRLQQWDVLGSSRKVTNIVIRF